MKKDRVTAGTISDRIGADLAGDASVVINNPAPFESASDGDITFAAQPAYLRLLDSSKASAIVVPRGVECKGKTLLLVDNPLSAFVEVIKLFHPPKKHNPGLSPWAVVDSTSTIEKSVTIYPLAYVGKNVRIGERTVLYPGVMLLDNVSVGSDCVLYPNCVVYDGCRIGNRVIIHSGTVIGADGFGYYRDESGHRKIPQVGIVDIEDDVEIGANTTIDRAALEKTLIGRGTKIDNLVQVGHNVRTGERCILVSQVGISGSTRIGNDVILAGQVGVADHVNIGDNVIVGGQSGVSGDLAESGRFFGSPAVSYMEWIKYVTILPRLPELRNKIRKLEKDIEKIKKSKGVKP
ncbi:MAG TPA: UDP-3-O-(3-hydroxymyristoyl)glucosamine N-acyltransferase [bacterium]